MLLRYSTIKILLPKVVEAGHSLAPTSVKLFKFSQSSGDSLSYMHVMKRKKWTNKKFVEHHTGGSLATSLIQVKEIMAKGKEIPLISSNKMMRAAITEMNKKNLGIVCVKDKNSIMLLTDGDIRRHSNNLYKKKIVKVATKNPTWIADTDTALSAINIMNSKGITSLLVAKKRISKKRLKDWWVSYICILLWRWELNEKK